MAVEYKLAILAMISQLTPKTRLKHLKATLQKSKIHILLADFCGTNFFFSK
jgi:hypothetical protein